MYRVLLVEDDAAMRFVYRKMKAWTECGFQIAGEATNGKHALDLMAKESFDLIFTDIRMPFVDGIEMMRRMEAAGNHTTVVFASSYDEFEYARQGLILGAFDYLLKPVDADKMRDVLTRVKEHLEENEARKEAVEPAVEEVLKHYGLTSDSGKFVHQVATFFSAHYGEIITMEDAADELGYSKDYFGKLFKQKFGTTFRDVLSRVRIAYAADLLRSGNYMTYQISEMLGYSSTDYFTKVFKEVTGETPSKFKARLEETGEQPRKEALLTDA